MGEEIEVSPEITWNRYFPNLHLEVEVEITYREFANSLNDNLSNTFDYLLEEGEVWPGQAAEDLNIDTSTVHRNLNKLEDLIPELVKSSKQVDLGTAQERKIFYLEGRKPETKPIS